MPKKKSNKKLRGQKQLHQKKKAPPSAGSHRNNFTAVELAAAAEQAINTGQDPCQAIALYDAAIQAVKVMMSTTPPSTTPKTPGATIYSNTTTTLGDDDDQNKKYTKDGDSTSANSTTLDLALLLEKRAEIKVSVSNPDGARQDYQEALQVLLLLQPPPPAPALHGNKADQQYQDASAAAYLERIASLHLYMGQLSQGNEALTCYRNGIQALQTSLQKRQETVVVVASLADDNLDAMVEVREQLAAACCSAAELYLTDMCYEDDAELQCEAYLQQALHDYTDNRNGPTTDALQTAANLRLSQCRGNEAVDYILQCYQQMKPACRALAALVGIRDDTDNDDGDDSKNNDKAPASAAAAAVDSSSHNDNTARATKELTEIEAVQSLPGFEFRCQTAKILLECAGFLKEELQQQQEQKGNADDIDDAKMSSNNNNDDNAAALPPQQDQQRHKMILCAQAAIDVLASLLAENDEVIEIWFLMGDAYAALVPTLDNNNHDQTNAAKNRNDDDADSSPGDNDDDDNYTELAQHYWNKTLEMLESVKGSLEQESMESSSQEEEDDLQQQLDEILCQMDDVRCKLSEISRSTPGTGSSSSTRRKASATKTSATGAQVMMEE